MLKIDKELENRIKKDVDEYFIKNDMKYMAKEIYRQSQYPDDDYLYMVIAERTDNKGYAVWTSWNTGLRSINYGHYGISSLSSCHEIIEEFTRYIF